MTPPKIVVFAPINTLSSTTIVPRLSTGLGRSTNRILCVEVIKLTFGPIKTLSPIYILSVRSIRQFIFIKQFFPMNKFLFTDKTSNPENILHFP
jgi:hypothetical protein